MAHVRPTHRPLSRSFLGLPYRILNISHKQELLRGLWVQYRFRVEGFGLRKHLEGSPGFRISSQA